MIKISVWINEKLHTISAQPNELILSALTKQGIKIPTPCGGNGTCGKCAVDTSHGVKLACNTPVCDGMEIYLNDIDAKEAIVVQESYESHRNFSYTRTAAGQANAFGIAIDIGTTTLAFELINMTTGQKIATHTQTNSQRAIGADVVTRIKQATQGASQKLHEYILEDIQEGIKHCLKKSELDYADITAVSIAGNTTMLHLLQDLPCDTLGVFPFTPVDIKMRHCNFSDVFTAVPIDAKLLILPGISTFVGADISAGILCCGGRDSFNQHVSRKGRDSFNQHSGHKGSDSGSSDISDNVGIATANLLIDLGTNGEMALFTNDSVLVTSTAAGPAFEAGNIFMGTASIPGAIAKVRFLPETNVFIYETINNQPPIGICGTGVVDIAAQIIRHGLADETGRLEDDYFDNGVTIATGITFTQKDIREVQLAKSAVRSGIEILLHEAGLGYEDINQVFLAGGFGFRMDMESATDLGLIPKELTGKTIAVGNTSLGGASHVLTCLDAEASIIAIANQAKEINLSAHPRFNDLFMEHMMFDA